ncbi:MAG: DHA1 family bicyclomycin/chloramphenicol resistance-like MFS transporter [Parasphingorhabdus sp.]|jgi:DHA1 family bicyclomycin/chloramphenicol resistance-like MFS transporter
MDSSTPKYSWSPPLWYFALVSAVSVMGITMLSPALPLIKQQFNATDDAVQLLITGYLIAISLGQLYFGRLSDQVGRRPVMMVGALLYTLGGAGGYLANSVDWVTGFRVVQGIGAAACFSMARAIINDCFKRSEAARYMSLVQTIMAVIPALSLAFGGIVVTYMGWRGTMLIMSLAGLLSLVSSLYLLRETLVDRSLVHSHTIWQAYRVVLGNRIFLGFAMTTAMQSGMFFSLTGLLPYQYSNLGFTSMEFGLGFSLTPVCYVIGNALNRYYFLNLGLERASLLGCSINLVAVIGFFAANAMGMTHILSLIIPGCLFGFSNGLIVANTSVGAVAASGRHAGTGAGIAGALQMGVGGVAGSVLVAAGGAQDFMIAAVGLVGMSSLSLASMFYVNRNKDECFRQA